MAGHDDEDCQICFDRMDNGAHLPRILLCGHTFCTKCVASILESTIKSCPSCRKQTSFEKVDDYPVNYFTLEIINKTKDALDDEKRVLKKKEHYQKQFLKLNAEYVFIKPIIEMLHANYELATEKVEQLNTIFGSEEDFDWGNAKPDLKDLDDILERVRSCNIVSGSTVNDVSLDCKDFEDVTLLLVEIRKGIRTSNQKFAALLRVDGVKMFARLKFSDRYLTIHSFEKLEETHDFITIGFQDLLQALLGSYPICAFFELCYKDESLPIEVIVQVSDSASFMGSQFLKLVTGEMGWSYKGREYSQDYNSNLYKQCIIQLKNVGWNLTNLDNYAKYFLGKNSVNITVPKDTCYLACQADGSFEIFRHTYAAGLFYNVIGPIVDFNGDLFLEFRDANLRYIADCGIAFKVGR